MYLKVIPGTELAGNNQKQNKQNPSVSPGERGESDFQIYHIMRFKHSVFNNKKNHKDYKETGKYGPFKGKNKPTVTIPEKDQMTNLRHKDFKETP